MAYTNLTKVQKRHYSENRLKMVGFSILKIQFFELVPNINKSETQPSAVPAVTVFLLQQSAKVFVVIFRIID